MLSFGLRENGSWQPLDGHVATSWTATWQPPVGFLLPLAFPDALSCGALAFARFDSHHLWCFMLFNLCRPSPLFNCRLEMRWVVRVRKEKIRKEGGRLWKRFILCFSWPRALESFSLLGLCDSFPVNSFPFGYALYFSFDCSSLIESLPILSLWSWNGIFLSS